MQNKTGDKLRRYDFLKTIFSHGKKPAKTHFYMKTNLSFCQEHREEL